MKYKKKKKTLFSYIINIYVYFMIRISNYYFILFTIKIIYN